MRPCARRAGLAHSPRRKRQSPALESRARDDCLASHVSSVSRVACAFTRLRERAARAAGTESTRQRATGFGRDESADRQMKAGECVRTRHCERPWTTTQSVRARPVRRAGSRRNPPRSPLRSFGPRGTSVVANQRLAGTNFDDLGEVSGPRLGEGHACSHGRFGALRAVGNTALDVARAMPDSACLSPSVPLDVGDDVASVTAEEDVPGIDPGIRPGD